MADDQPPKPGRFLIRTGAVLAWITLVLFIGVLVASAVPVHNNKGVPDAAATAALRARTNNPNASVLHDGPTVIQDCGSPLLYLTRGTTDIVFTSDGATKLKDAQADYAYRHRCRVRVANRMVPTAIALLVAIGLGITGFVLTLIGRSRQRHAANAVNIAPTAVG